jgi:hypothetical protein
MVIYLDVTSPKPFPAHSRTLPPSYLEMGKKVTRLWITLVAAMLNFGFEEWIDSHCDTEIFVGFLGSA